MQASTDLNDHPSMVRFQAFGSLTDAELGSMVAMVREQRVLSKGSLLQEEGERTSRIHLLLKGWTASSILLPDGRRQILKVHMAGDLVGLPSLAVVTAPDTVVALTDVTTGHIDLASLGNLFRDHPRVAALLFLISQEERLMLMDRLTLVGRRDTAGGVAGVLLQLHARALRRDPDLGNTLHLPLTQADLADMVGATTIHVNRVLTDLRARRTVSWLRGEVVIHDLLALRRIAGLPERVAKTDHHWLPHR